MTGAAQVTEEAAAASPPRGLGYLVGSEGISVAGDWVLLTAAAVTVFKETGSTTAVSLMLGLAVVPTVLLGPIAGAVADGVVSVYPLAVFSLTSLSASAAAFAGVGNVFVWV